MFGHDNEWGSKLVKNLIQTIDEDPLLYELKIDNIRAPQIYKALKDEKEIQIEIFNRSFI